jgi:small-conductance mechanosensitive channel
MEEIPFNLVWKDENLRRIIWEEKYMLSRERNHKIQSQLHLRQQVAFREEIAQLREELFYMKVIIVIVIMFMWFVANEASVKDRAWFGDNGIDVLKILWNVLRCFACFAWFYWTWLNATRWWWDGVVIMAVVVMINGKPLL